MAKKTQKTWSHLLGPVCIFLDREWKDGQLVEIKTDHVVYSISDDSTQYIITKDEAYNIIRKRIDLTKADKSGAYTGKNPMVFGPAGKNLYGKKVYERKDRPGCYRVEIKYRSQKYAKVRNIKISLGKHTSFESAASVADEHIYDWLMERTKHASTKRKRAKWITKMGARKLTPTKCNTPKRITTTATRRTRRTAAAVTTPDKKVFSPLAPTMLRTPVVKVVQKKKKKNKSNKNKSHDQLEAEAEAEVSFLLCLRCVSAFYFYVFQRFAHLKEIRQRAKEAVANRIRKRVAKYKSRLRTNLPPQIEKWTEREKRLIAVITGAASLDALLVRECPDPPVEVDPDTDEEETKTDEQTTALPEEEGKVDDVDDENYDPTTRPWTKNEETSRSLFSLLAQHLPPPFTHTASAAALEISQKQRSRLLQQAMAMSHYCSKVRAGRRGGGGEEGEGEGE